MIAVTWPSLMSRRWLLIATLLASGCPGSDKGGGGDGGESSGGDGGGDGGAELVDQDGDGVDSTEDCDDNDDDINPDAVERCDGVDNDCDGQVDADDDSLDEDSTERLYTDEDGDGYGAGDSFRGCAEQDGVATEDGDCDDSDKQVNPGKREVCNDGVDNNCDDDMGDCGTWGEVELDESTADAFLYADLGDTNMPGLETLNGISHGDFDGDGADDLVVGAEEYGYVRGGQVWVFEGTVQGTKSTTRASTIVDGNYGYYDLGASVMGDYDGDRDGYQDLVIGAPYVDAVIAFDGPFPGDMNVDDLWGYWQGGEGLGELVFPADLDGDGEKDLMIGADEAIYGIAGTLGSNGPTGDDPTYTLTTSTVRAEATDLDGDGFDEIVLLDEGAAWILPGGWTGDVTLADSAIAVEGEDGSSISTTFALGDLNEDGHADLLIDGKDSTDVIALFGPLDSARTADDPDLRVTTDVDGINTFDTLDDFTGDGHIDLMIGAASTYDAWFKVLEGPFLENANARDAVLTISGDMDSIKNKRALGAGDLDDDGTEDLLISDPGGNWDGNDDCGVLFLYSGGGL